MSEYETDIIRLIQQIGEDIRWLRQRAEGSSAITVAVRGDVLALGGIDRNHPRPIDVRSLDERQVMGQNDNQNDDAGVLAGVFVLLSTFSTLAAILGMSVTRELPLLSGLALQMAPHRGSLPPSLS